MTPEAVEQLAAGLLEGKRAAARPWEVGEAVTWIADAITRRDPAVKVEQVRAAAGALKGAKQFEHTRGLARAWRDVNGFDPTIEKLYAQSLIELSAFDEAEALLRTALQTLDGMPTTELARKERLEFRGLLGRVAKQRFVENQDPDQLRLATDLYYAVWDGTPGKPYWHGINAIALLAREVREDLTPRDGVDVQAMAAGVLAQVSKKLETAPDDHWGFATMSEACLALGRCDEAELWLYRFLLHAATDPFAVNSYARQLREIWQGRIVGPERTCADRLAGIMSRHQMREQGMWLAQPSDLQSAASATPEERDALEKNFSRAFGFSVDAVRTMLGACASIACITNGAGERLGTGWMVKGSALRAAWGDAPVMVTNAHVISNEVKAAIRVDQARATFEVESTASVTPKFYPVSELLFTSPPPGEVDKELDVTVVRLDGLPADCCTLPATDLLPTINARTRAYVIGHPKGSGLQISLHDSVLLDVDDDERLVHYRTPTEPGSSGSPVFNSAWEVIAVHHSGSSQTKRLHGSGTYEANEGISVKAVQKRLAAI
ncbi:MAG: serine protease [Vicinamibacterales bacterium]